VNHPECFRHILGDTKLESAGGYRFTTRIAHGVRRVEN
ncbi:MAG: hypothetical protein ACI9F9_003124, partial [Candidatus Paceibacteria bacterium]